MATAVQKITLSPSRDIPFNKLILSQSNVRRIKAGVSIEELSQDIARRGLLQGLNVRPVVDADGVETGMFEIPAGGRRYRALELLVKAKRLAKTAPVPCIVREAGSAILAEDDSLAENIQRAPLHPLDQYRAFQDMRIKGMSEEEIAAAFFVSVNVVKQRLRLAAVAPSLLDLYAEDGMALEQLMAFTVNPDHARQEQVWDAIKDSWSKEPHQIRRMLTETTVRASDKRAQFVGVEAYEASGGIVLNDLFQSDDGGWLQDVALLDQLTDDKLKAEAEVIAAEGWKWVDARVEVPYGYGHGLRRLIGATTPLTEEEQASFNALTADYEALEAEYAEAEEYPDEVDERVGEIETALAAFEDRTVIYDPAEIAQAGVFISIDREGRLSVDRGYVRPEDEKPVTVESDDETDGAESDGGSSSTAAVERAVITVGGQPAEPEEEDDVIKPLPERLVAELTAHRTLALHNALANNPHVAMTALLHRLVMERYHYSAPGGCLEVGVRHHFFSSQGTDLKDSPSAKAIDTRYEDWKADLPTDDDALWDWIAALDDASRMALLAHCVAYGVNALYEKPNPFSGSGISQHGLERRLAQADRMARATGLDMVETAGWRPTVENYLGRITKPRILEAVREGAGERAASLIEHLKKGDMAKEAERLLADTGWLPEPLRLFEPEQSPVDADAQDDIEALPDFLAGDDEDESYPDNDAAHLIAAE
ncbi:MULTISPECIES: ParB/RepB/Spo0J family partition protein [Agrobacterium]|uniref:ParB/RepB/Spo0J family partition protein n=1 Tax=Agrobacterium pusense TaxID=648995 RepID=A0AA44ENC8_9HYPH|nr:MULTISPECIES: ParB/RepB/Spo0J family partition protein [Agrobacterium]NRF11309.1 ParB/RepB/Spo0J family partition protein [Agrobacterium pusense]NRF22019.1 ParB/RepB/Spo0J family partition protein [Agrobacterium pusense]CDN95774.1 Plasmid stabilization protein [Agrobacterium tumefaciens]